MTIVRDSITGPIGRAITEISQRDGVALSVVDRNTSLRQFGIRDDLEDTKFIVAPMAGEAAETLLTTDGITSVVTTDAAADQTLTVDGHTLSGGVFTAVTQTVTLNGQTAVTLDTPLARVSFAVNTSADVLLGDVYFYQGGTTTAGVPNISTEVHMQIPAGRQTSVKCATTIADGDYWFITDVGFSVMRKQSAVVDADLQVAPPGQVFRSVLDFSASSDASGPHVIKPDPLIIVPPNSDVRMCAVGPDTPPIIAVAAYMAGYFASVEGTA